MESYTIYKRNWEIDGKPASASVSISYTKDWDIKLEEYLTGDDLEKQYGDWDHEEWLIIKRLNAPKLMNLLFRYSFNQSEPLTISKLRKLLTEEQIDFEHGMWA
jgi:hypothetical protein